MEHDPQRASAWSPEGGFELRFASLFQEGRGLAFPCDSGGRVNLDGLSQRALDNYLFARVATGREYATPRVVPRLRD
jgi:hypothetical protein